MTKQGYKGIIDDVLRIARLGIEDEVSRDTERAIADLITYVNAMARAEFGEDFYRGLFDAEMDFFMRLIKETMQKEIKEKERYGGV